MSGDDGKQTPRTRSKKRRHLCIADTDSSDDAAAAAVSTVKPRRKPSIDKTSKETNRKERGKSMDSEAAGSSKSEADKRPVEKTKETSARKSVKKEAKNSRDSKTRRSSETAIKAVESAAEVKKDENGDESAEHCSICWLPFKEQEVAVPATCDHSFCLQCILKWTGNSNTCPVDRLKFNTIDVHQHYGGKKLRQMPIETKSPCEVATGDEAGDEAGDGDNPFAMLFSNSASSEWDLDLSNSELDYDSSLREYMTFESASDPDDSSCASNDTGSSFMDSTPSDFQDICLEALGQDGSSLSCQDASSPVQSDYSNVETLDNFSTPPHPSITLRQSSSSESSDASISFVDSLASSPSPPPSLDSCSSATSY